ncbi:HTH-type transcriptional repressor CytR [Abditibacteriota bacterium]|nr:HTH-type transcriptional repressor CytR [Abditibacteriota bacterium]
MPSINDVAKLAQVSAATVSRSFRSPELLSAETLMRVAEAARELNYEPRGLRGEADSLRDEREVVSVGQQDAIGFQFLSQPGIERSQLNSFYSPMLMGAQEEAASCGFNMLIHTTDSQHLEKELPQMVLQRSIDGMVLVGGSNSGQYLSLFAEHLPHIILLDDHDPLRQFESVVSDGFGGMYRATQFLLELGHRRIAFFLGESEVRIYQDRMHGYAAALLDAGLVPTPELIIGNVVDASFESRESRLTNMLARSDRPTALLVANDDHALYVMRILRRMGMRAPEDISIIGFDNAALSLHSDPPLTTIAIDKEGMGRLAAKRLIARIRSPRQSVQLPVVNKVSTSLVVRQSCRPF